MFERINFICLIYTKFIKTYNIKEYFMYRVTLYDFPCPCISQLRKQGVCDPI